LKTGWARRNGVPLSDRATMREYFFRHDDILTHVAIVVDPVYLTEPLIRSNEFRHALNGTTIAYPCRPAIEIPRPRGAVPHYLPGQNPYLEDDARVHGVPVEAARGGAHTALPEYMNRMKSLLRAESGSTTPMK
jgi:hypothetical protein